MRLITLWSVFLHPRLFSMKKNWRAACVLIVSCPLLWQKQLKLNSWAFSCVTQAMLNFWANSYVIPGFHAEFLVFLANSMSPAIQAEFLVSWAKSHVIMTIQAGYWIPELVPATQDELLLSWANTHVTPTIQLELLIPELTVVGHRKFKLNCYWYPELTLMWSSNSSRTVDFLSLLLCDTAIQPNWRFPELTLMWYSYSSRAADFLS